MEYIERDAAINALTEEALVQNLDSVMDGLSNRIKRSAHRILASLPAADVAPVKHGRWVNEEQVGFWTWEAECSCCGVKAYKQFRFCQNCGAMMDKDGDGE